MADTLTTALRIMARDIDCEDGVATTVMLQAADEIERLREAIRRLAEQDATLSVCEGNVTVEIDGTLTPEEREAVEWFADYAETPRTPAEESNADTLRGLLERTK